ncbi:hypothetical protein [uncultured Bacteroides sp.]|uniref:SLOG domain-containing protein n=1 Tax=uncultured Bacteroides sp. TaxID=162156 RepID=UPI0025FD060E|nr:hypothetical protein [uncultured Bacteroides sp.]
MDTINNVKNIFLSASVPLEERDPKFFKTADVIAIRDAVIALAATVLANKEYHLIWGGHPSITPLIMLVLERYGLKMSDRVTLYQSKEFEKFFLPENEDIGIRVITDKKESRDASLLLMRQKMIGDHKYEAAVFIGGMEGVLNEFSIFKELHPGIVCLPIASTGAAARMLFEKHPESFDRRLQTELSYTSLFKELLNI